MSYEAWGTPPDPEPRFCPLCDSESHADGCELGEMQKRAINAEQQRDELMADAKESEAVRDRLATLLSETAIALKGEEEALQRHSWHDLPVVALAAMIEITILKQQRGELIAALKKLSGMKLNMIADSIVDKALASVKGQL